MVRCMRKEVGCDGVGLERVLKYDTVVGSVQNLLDQTFSKSEYYLLIIVVVCVIVLVVCLEVAHNRPLCFFCGFEGSGKARYTR